MSKATISKKDERLLHTKSGNRCALCRIPLVDVNSDDEVCIGENAHIYGEKPGSARYDKRLSEDFVNSEKNLIFMCCNCHKKIDSDENKYPADQLFDLKEKHEKWVLESYSKACSEFGFAELEVLTKYLINNKSVGSNFDYDIISIKDKIDKNSLNDVSSYIMMGLTRCKTIEDYFNQNPDPSFANTITNNIAKEYIRLKQELNDSLEVFYALQDYACGHNTGFNYMAAGLSIVTYFFEKCEVFEK